MDIQTLKLDLVQRILNTRNEAILAKVNNIFQEESDNDWWNQLPLEVQDAILNGISDINDGNTFTNDQVIKEAKIKYKF
jgi:hypothetical protein